MILVAHRLSESGVLSDSETNIVTRQRRTSSFEAFGEPLFFNFLGQMVQGPYRYYCSLSSNLITSNHKFV